MLNWILKDETLTLSGSLDKTSCMKLWNDRSELLGDKKSSVKERPIIFDLSKINKIDTAGLATLISLYAEAQQSQINLSFKNASQQFIDLAKLSGVIEILPLN